MQSLIVAHGVTYVLPDGRRLLDRLELKLTSGVTGLVGANGIGKSCLARILAGQLEPDAGAIHRASRVGLLEQHAPRPATRVGEYLEGCTSSSGARLLDGIDPATRCDALSGGEWMRVRLARTLDDSFLILDEPTNNLDREARAFLAGFLQERHCGTLLISHDRECLEHCSVMLELTKHGIARFPGGWTQYWQARGQERTRLARVLDNARRERAATEAERHDQAQRRHRHLQHASRTAARGGMPRLLLGARKRQAQVTGGKRAAKALDQLDRSVAAAREAQVAQKIDPVMHAAIVGRPVPSQVLVAAARDFNVRHKDWVYPHDLQFEWRGNVRIAIRGGNGSGKSTLLQALRGAPFAARGELRRGQLPTVYLDQWYGGLREDLSVLENAAAQCPGSERELRTGLAAFLFRGGAVRQRVATLSGGERLRAALAVEFLRVPNPQLMLLDEPTNNLDIGNVELLEQIVRGFSGALLVVSHDERFLQQCGVTSALAMSYAN